MAGGFIAFQGEWYSCADRNISDMIQRDSEYTDVITTPFQGDMGNKGRKVKLGPNYR